MLNFYFHYFLSVFPKFSILNICYCHTVFGKFPRKLFDFFWNTFGKCTLLTKNFSNFFVLLPRGYFSFYAIQLLF